MAQRAVGPVMRGAMVRRVSGLLLIVALLLGATGGAVTKKPPFQLGPSGGDSFNYVSADPSGAVTTVRMYPLPPEGVRCSGSAGWATLLVNHTSRMAKRSLRVAYTNAAVDPYTFVTVTAKIGNRYIGSKKVRGPLVGDGTVAVPLAWPAGTTMRSAQVLFGLELTSACPAVDGAHIEFTSVTLSPKRLSGG